MKNYKGILGLVLAVFVSSNCKTEGATGDIPTLNSEPVKIVTNFFAWYIYDSYKQRPGYFQFPPYKKIAENSFIFDLEEFEKRLNEIQYLSNSFKISLVKKLEICNSEMKKMSWDSEPEPQFNIKACDYLWYDNWIGGQGENIDGFKIIDSNVIGDNVEVLVQVSIAGKPFVKVNVDVGLEEKKYKIFNIQLKWE
jgi:hypothetical protein